MSTNSEITNQKPGEKPSAWPRVGDAGELWLLGAAEAGFGGGDAGLLLRVPDALPRALGESISTGGGVSGGLLGGGG